MNRREAEINLAALLDGELRDPRQVAELNALLERDPQLRAEYEAQRELKAALGGLAPSAEQQAQHTPDFMATRVLGEIAARRRSQRSGLSLWRPVVAWGGSFAALMIGFFTTVQVMQPMANSAALTAQSEQAARQPEALLPTGLTRNVSYAPQYWADFKMPEGVNDPQVASFLKFANEAHNYRRLMHSSGGDTTPDISPAIMAVNETAGNVVFASDENAK